MKNNLLILLAFISTCSISCGTEDSARGKYMQNNRNHKNEIPDNIKSLLSNNSYDNQIQYDLKYKFNDIANLNSQSLNQFNVNRIPTATKDWETGATLYHQLAIFQDYKGLEILIEKEKVNYRKKITNIDFDEYMSRVLNIEDDKGYTLLDYLTISFKNNTSYGAYNMLLTNLGGFNCRMGSKLNIEQKFKTSQNRLLSLVEEFRWSLYNKDIKRQVQLLEYFLNSYDRNHLGNLVDGFLRRYHDNEYYFSMSLRNNIAIYLGSWFDAYESIYGISLLDEINNLVCDNSIIYKYLESMGCRHSDKYIVNTILAQKDTNLDLCGGSLRDFFFNYDSTCPFSVV